MLRNLLKQKNAYYSYLSADGQAKFQQRLFEFMQSKTFTGCNGLLITDEMRVLISAAAVQLTFGLDDFIIFHLHTVNVFQNSFTADKIVSSVDELISQSGVLSISWEDFREEDKNENNRLNPALYGLAHVINNDLNEPGNFDDHFSVYFNEWKESAPADFFKLKKSSSPFLRSYGGTNMYEFFALCTEHFFESPSEFKALLPDLFNHMTLMLNQDPLNTDGDYRIKKEVIYYKTPDEEGEEQQKNGAPFVNTKNGFQTKIKSEISIKERFRNFIKTKGVYAAMIVIVAGLIGIQLLFWFASVTVINAGTMLVMLFACGAIGLFQWKYVKDYLDIEYRQFAMYAFVGFGICFLNLILLLNFAVRINSYSKTYDFLNGGFNEIILSNDSQNNALERTLNNYLKNHPHTESSDKKITINIETGLFGFDIIKDCTFN